MERERGLEHFYCKKKKKNTNTIGELSCNPSMEAEKGTLVREVVMLDGLIARVAGES